MRKNKLITVKQLQSKIEAALSKMEIDKTIKRVDISCGAHLGVIVRPTSMSWVAIYKVPGNNPTKEAIKTIDHWESIDIILLNQVAKIANSKFKNAIDRNTNKDSINEIPTLEKYIKEYCSRFVPDENKTNSNKSSSRYSNIKSALKHFSSIYNYKLNLIDPNLVDLALDQDEENSSKEVTPSTKRNAIIELRRLYNAAVGDTIIKINPLKNMLIGKSRFADKYAAETSESKEPIPFEDLDWFYDQVSHLEEINIIATILQHLTCLRIGEISLLEWSWIDYSNKVISIPKGIMKNSRPFNVPISPFIMSLLKYWNNKCFKDKKKSKYLFYSKSSLKLHRAKGRFMEDLHSVVHGVYTYHSIRTTFRTWGAGLLIDSDICSVFISHTIKSNDPSDRYYNRQDFFESRAKLMKIWNFKLYPYIKRHFNKYFEFLSKSDISDAEALVREFMNNPETFFVNKF